MDPIILLLIGLSVILLLLAVGGFLFWRSRPTKDSPSAEKTSPAKQPGLERVEPPAVTNQTASPMSSGPAATLSPGKAASSGVPTASVSPPSAQFPPSPPPLSGDQGQDEDGASDIIRILVVDDNQDTINHVERLLYFEDNMEVVGQALNGRLGIDMAIEKQPHIVLMDINMPDMDGIIATKHLTEQVPFSQVIMISVQSDPEYMKKAMMAGARDYQPKPFSADELIASIQRVYEIGQPTYQQFSPNRVAQVQAAAASTTTLLQGSKNGIVVAIYSPKGGVGTSTIAANLAAVLQYLQKDVALMDADFQFGDIQVHLNTRDTRNVCDLIRDKALELELLPDILVSHDTGLKLLLAPSQPAEAELIQPAMISEIIDDLRKRFKLIIVDTHNLLTDQTLTVLDNADFVLLVTVPELPAVKNAKLFLDLTQEFSSLAAKRMALIVNAADKFGAIPIKQIEQALKLPQTYQLPQDEVVSTYINSGKVVTQQSGKSSFAQGILKLAQALVEEIEQSTVPDQDAVTEMA